MSYYAELVRLCLFAPTQLDRPDGEQAKGTCVAGREEEKRKACGRDHAEENSPSLPSRVGWISWRPRGTLQLCDK